jgi:hypothetical protein
MAIQNRDSIMIKISITLPVNFPHAVLNEVGLGMMEYQMECFAYDLLNSSLLSRRLMYKMLDVYAQELNFKSYKMTIEEEPNE